MSADPENGMNSQVKKMAQRSITIVEGYIR
jgi:hypothetical protein